MKFIKDKNKKFLITIISLILILMFICYIISPVFVPKWNTETDNYVGQSMDGYYQEKRNSLDILYVGNSSVFYGISPKCIYEASGLNGYNIAVGSSRTWTEYYMIKTALKTQKPKTIVLNIDCAFDDSDVEEVYVRKAYDHIKISKEKIEAISSKAYDFDFNDKLSFVFPVLRYHDRWQELNTDDIRYAYSLMKSDDKGYISTTKTIPYNYGFDYLSNNDNTKNIGTKSIEYLDKIVSLCKDNSINLVFVVVPSTENWDNDKHNSMEDYCNKNNIVFKDFNNVNGINEIGIDWTKDSCDGGIHLNSYGAEKTSKAIAKLLIDSYN